MSYMYTLSVSLLPDLVALFFTYYYTPSHIIGFLIFFYVYRVFKYTGENIEGKQKREQK